MQLSAQFSPIRKNASNFSNVNIVQDDPVRSRSNNLLSFATLLPSVASLLLFVSAQISARRQR